LTEDEDLIG